MIPQTPLVQVVLYALLPGLVVVAGAVIAALRTPGPHLRSALQHFAAGVVFEVAAAELLPDIVRTHTPIETVVGFALGVATMLGIRQFTERLEGEEGSPGQGAPTDEAPPNEATGVRALGAQSGLLGATGVDLLIDGLLLGIGFAAGQREGRLLALALTMELLSLGLATATTLRGAGVHLRRVLMVVGGLTLLFWGGALVGATALTALTGGDLAMVLSFGLAALLYLVTEELLVEAHQRPDTPLIVAAFFAGFLVFLVLGIVT